MDKIVSKEMIDMDLDKARLESLRRSKEMEEIQKFIYGDNKNNSQKMISGMENANTNTNPDSTID